LLDASAYIPEGAFSQPSLATDIESARSLLSAIYHGSSFMGHTQEASLNIPSKQFIKNFPIEPDGMAELFAIHARRP